MNAAERTIPKPRKLVHVDPVYPAIAARMGVQGVVTLSAVITPEGEVTNLEVVESIPVLDKAAIEAARQWRYAPSPTPVDAVLMVEFSLDP